MIVVGLLLAFAAADAAPSPEAPAAMQLEPYVGGAASASLAPYVVQITPVAGASLGTRLFVDDLVLDAHGRVGIPMFNAGIPIAHGSGLQYDLAAAALDVGWHLQLATGWSIVAEIGPSLSYASVTRCGGFDCVIDAALAVGVEPRALLQAVPFATVTLNLTVAAPVAVLFSHTPVPYFDLVTTVSAGYSFTL